MTSVFLDTDFILDLFVEREPHHTLALQFFSHLQMHADNVQAFTSPVVDRAIQRPGRDYEDSLQYQCAVAGAATTIITRNRGDFPTEGVQVLAPDEFMKMDLAERATKDSAAPRPQRLGAA